MLKPVLVYLLCLLAPSPPLAAEQFLQFAMSRNYPFAHSRKHLDPGVPHGALSLRFLPNSDWSVGVGLQIKVLRERALGRYLPLLTLSQESYRIFRVHYPLFLLVGGRLLYLRPGKSFRSITSRHDVHDPEVGGAVGLGLMWRLNKSSVVELRLERWRGTGSLKFQGLESSICWAWLIG